MTSHKYLYPKYENKLNFPNKFSRLIWNFVYIFFFRPFSFPLFNGWRIFLLRLFGAKIGSGCKIHASAKFWAPWNFEVGHRTAIASGVNCYNPGKIIIGNKVAISQYTFLCTATHDYTSRKYPLVTKTITIHDWCWVAADAFISPGITIGQGSIVGARAVVTKDVAPWTVVAGNPAKFIKNRVFKD
ncbi:acetyltransferase [Desulfomicrobium baculatum]|uniref:Putative acetyltransferase n=1 Tax=Desulfomicrobium baculatum (strain DSM 4028 / VKM B-1378 / X) TaxID=525897 RepID=C7LS76_DESBD|nr:acetyltransferase [Desulfomicrobium baculatum]ACU90624.1 putative acetyltransferase [Desulfomicrobium baculatum DSM 4028]